MNLKKLVSNSTILYSYPEIIEAINNIADECNERFEGQSVSVLPVMKGALPFAGHLIPMLNFHLELDYIHATRYIQNAGTNQVRWLYEPNIEHIKNKTVLILDDILDVGITLTCIKKKLIELGAKEVWVAVLFDKKLRIKKSTKADFMSLDVPDKYVYGFVLDFDGIGRNIQHLYAYNKINN
ncbi:MAG: phosphoribosyltransferase family protein [Methylophilaceae bacterium]